MGEQYVDGDYAGMHDDRVRVRVIVRGRVQGVGYRQRAVEQAHRLGVGGWVRNLSHARVETLVEGPRAAVFAMVEWLKHGPRLARVDECTSNWEPDRAEFSTFTTVR